MYALSIVVTTSSLDLVVIIIDDDKKNDQRIKDCQGHVMSSDFPNFLWALLKLQHDGFHNGLWNQTLPVYWICEQNGAQIVIDW